MKSSFQIPIINAEASAIKTEVHEGIAAMMRHLESLLASRKYFCGDDITLADLSILGSVAFLFVRIQRPETA